MCSINFGSKQICIYLFKKNQIQLLIFYVVILFLPKRNEVGSSSAMEFEGFKRSFQFLENHGLDVSTFVSDRHLSIMKYIREELTSVTHFFDLWHLKKS